MQAVTLPLTTCMEACALVAILAVASMPLLLPTLPAWQLALSISTLLIGAVSWTRYRRRRPQQVWMDSRKRLWVRLSDGWTAEIRQTLPGVVSPGIVTAILVTVDGHRLPLFVPGRSVTAGMHWQLRRWLLSECHQARPDRDPAADHSGQGRGT